MPPGKDETETIVQSNYKPAKDTAVITAPRPIEPFRYVYASPPSTSVVAQSQPTISHQRHPSSSMGVVSPEQQHQSIAVYNQQPAQPRVVSFEPQVEKETYSQGRQQDIFSEVSEETIIPSMKQLFGDDFVTNLAHMLRNLKEFQTKEPNEEESEGENKAVQQVPSAASTTNWNDKYVPNNKNDLVLTQEYANGAVPGRVNYPLPNEVTPLPNVGSRQQPPQAPPPQYSSSQTRPTVASPPANKGLYPFSADYWRQIVENQRRKPKPVYTAPIPVEPTRSAPVQVNDRFNRQTPDMNIVFGAKVNQETLEGDLPLLGQSTLATIKCLDRSITIGRNELPKIACCGDQAYNVEKLVCINSQVISMNNRQLSLPTGAPAQSLPKVVAKVNLAGFDVDYRRLHRKPKIELCGKVYYNTEERTCCNKKLYNKKPGQVRELSLFVLSLNHRLIYGNFSGLLWRSQLC